MADDAEQFYKCKKSFQRNEGDVGMSRHKKQGRKEDAYTKTEGDTQLHPYILEYATWYLHNFIETNIKCIIAW